MKQMPKKLINKIIGESFYELFQLSNLLIINIGEKIKFSFHIACFVRIIDKNKILLTSSDEFFDSKGDALESIESLGKRLNNLNSLLTVNIKKINELLIGKKVKAITQTRYGDLYIHFDNDIIIQIMIDCRPRHYECYRLIEYIPFYDIQRNNNSKHIVIYCNDGEIDTRIE